MSGEQQALIFKEFGVEECGVYINQTLGDKFYQSTSLMVAWDPDCTDKPNKVWLSEIWSFLSEQTHHITRFVEGIMWLLVLNF